MGLSIAVARWWPTPTPVIITPTLLFLLVLASLQCLLCCCTVPTNGSVAMNKQISCGVSGCGRARCPVRPSTHSLVTARARASLDRWNNARRHRANHTAAFYSQGYFLPTNLGWLTRRTMIVCHSDRWGWRPETCLRKNSPSWAPSQHWGRGGKKPPPPTRTEPLQQAHAQGMVGR